MLITVLKESLQIELGNYGLIEIPKGTKVDSKISYKSEKRYYNISEFNWIDKIYANENKKIKADLAKKKIPIPEKMLISALRLHFIYGDSGACRDIFKKKDGNQKYCRMESRLKNKVEWYTITEDWEEPECPLKCNMFIQLVDRTNKVVIMEQQEKIEGDYGTNKILPFSWEVPSTKEQEQLMVIYTR